MARRNFICPLTEERCEDSRCTVKTCFQIEEAGKKVRGAIAAKAADEMLDVLAEAKKVASAILKIKRVPSTEQLLTKLMENPAVLAEARRRVEWRKKL